MTESATCSSELLSAPTDDDLAHEVGHGDVDGGLRTLEQRYGRRLRHFVRRIVRDASAAEEVTQDVLETVYLRIHLYTPGTNFRAWLFEIARNRALSTLRSRKLSPRPSATLSGRADAGLGRDPLDLVPSREDGREVEEAELMLRLEWAVAELPDKYAQVFRLCVQQGLTYEQAARLLQVPSGTVAIRIMRARWRLYEMLKQDIGPMRRPPACMQGR